MTTRISLEYGRSEETEGLKAVDRSRPIEASNCPATMSTSQGPPSPSPSTLFLPLGRRSRRTSLSSISSSSRVDKETLCQALDQIHSSASQSGSLTTFNEFSSPPSSSSSTDNRGAVESVQSGLSGLYSKFRGVVGAGKDKSGTADESAFKVQSSGGPAPGSDSIRPALTTSKSPGSVSSSLISPATSTYGQTFPGTATSTEAVSRPDRSNGISSIKSPTLSLSAGTTAKTATPTVAQIHAVASKTRDQSDTGKSAGDGRATEVGRSGGKVESSTRTGSGREESPKNLESRKGSSPRPAIPGVADLIKDSEAPADKIDDSKLEESADGLEQSKTASGRTATQNNKARSNDRELPSAIIDSDFDGSHDGPDHLAMPKPAQSFQEPNTVKAEKVASKIRPPVSEKDDQTSQSQRPQPTSRISQSRLPGFRLSRASSTDTAFSSPPDSPLSRGLDKTSDRNKIAGQSNIPAHSLPAVTMEGGRANADTLQEFRTRILSKDFWMRDENSKECFRCGIPFTTWRRKHHCRTCGQIFDGKCTALIDGKVFGQTGSLRVCKPCENLIEGPQDISSASGSDGDDQHVLPASALRYNAKHNGGQRTPDPHASPMMAIPTRRIGDSSDRNSAILEIDPTDYSRPASSRSIRTPLTGRPRSSSHKRLSRHQLSRSLRGSTDDRAPFHRTVSDDTLNAQHLPAFHNDSIIDPALAPYMSDEGQSSEDEMSIFGALSAANDQSTGNDHDKHALTSSLAAARRGRSRLADKSISGMSFNSRDLDDGAGGSSKLSHFQRSTRKRNPSFVTSLHPRPTPRRSKSNLLAQGFGAFNDSLGTSPTSGTSPSSPVATGSRMTRSASMRGATAPAIELNRASLQHVRKLLHQMLQDAKIPNVSSWEKNLLPILLRCTDDVSPDVRRGDDIDIRHYIKIKKIPGGKPGDTAYVSGVVFRKNVALKSMSRNISYPRIILIRSAIEYSRSQQHFMSLEPVIAQEKESLRNKVNRILEFRPSLLLVQNNVSGVALQYLEEAGIATASNIKPSVIEAVGRCCRADINGSIEMLNLNSRPVGQSASFDIKTYVHKDIPGQKRTYVYLSGCPKELGCTVILRGADMKTLAKIKRITEFMVYVVYNLKLETCLMRDEYVSIPSVAEDTVKEAKSDGQWSSTQIDSNQDSGHISSGDRVKEDAPSTENPVDSSLASTKTSEDSSQAESKIEKPDDETPLPDDIPMPTFYSDMVEEHNTKILSASPFVKFMQPYLLMRAREHERRLVYFKRLRDQDHFNEAIDEKEQPQKFSLITPEMVHQAVKDTPRKVKEVLRAVHEAQYDKAMHSYQTQKRQWEAYIAGNINLFDPVAHQNIVVLFTLICTSTTVPCNGPEILALRFYDEHETEEEDVFDPDCTLGQFVESLCLGVNHICTANGCEKPMIDHHRQYVCGEAQISISVEREPCKINGMQDSILMWSWCKICQKDTQVMPMSESTWNYSFGKYLELSFWSSDLHLRANVCPHVLHRDHYRFFGFKDVAIRVQFTPVDLLEIVVPRARITWKVEIDLKLKNEVYTKIEDRLNRFMGSVKARIKGINIDSVLPEKAEACKAEIEKLTKRANEDHISLVRKLQDKYMNSKYYETVPLNRAIRALQKKVAGWDTSFADFDKDYFPSEKDIRRLAALQLKKIFLDRDESISSIASGETASVQSSLAEDGEQRARSASIEIAPRPTQMSPEEAHNVLTSVIEENSGVNNAVQGSGGDGGPSFEPQGIPPERLAQSPYMDHLDLAVPPVFSEHHDRERLPINSRSVSPTDTRDSKSTLPTTLPSTTPSSISIPSETTPDTQSEGADKALADSTKLTNSQSSLHSERSSTSIRSPQNHPPPLNRAYTQPAHVSRENSLTDTRAIPSPANLTVNNSLAKKLGELPKANQIDPVKSGDRKLSDRLGLSALKGSRKSGVSLIPRSVGKRKESKVSSLAKHFDQLSREFEKERLRERRRALVTRQSRAYPVASSKPIVEVYRNVNDAVGARDHSDDEVENELSLAADTAIADSATKEEESAALTSPAKQDMLNQISQEETTAENTESEEATTGGNQVESDADGSDIDHSLLEDVQIPDPLDASHLISALDSPLDFKIDLPKHERSSLMKMLTNFWAERSASGWTSLEYPL